MKEFKEYLSESIEVMGDSFEYIQEILKEKNIFSLLKISLNLNFL